jgi:hypothetical protein
VSLEVQITLICKCDYLRMSRLSVALEIRCRILYYVLMATTTTMYTIIYVLYLCAMYVSFFQTTDELY